MHIGHAITAGSSCRRHHEHRVPPPAPIAVYRYCRPGLDNQPYNISGLEAYSSTDALGRPARVFCTEISLSTDPCHGGCCSMLLAKLELFIGRGGWVGGAGGGGGGAAYNVSMHVPPGPGRHP